MDVALLNTVPETLDYVESISYVKVDDYSSVYNEIQNYNKIIILLCLLFIIYIFNLIFPYNKYYDNENTLIYNLYVALLIILLLSLIHNNDLYLLTAIFIIISLIVVPILMSIYFYMIKIETINMIFQMYNNQLKYVFSDDLNYYELIFNIIFISIIFILSIVLYWDNIYYEAKKISKCGTILTIIEENTYRKNPYVYNIIVIHDNSLNTKKKISNNIIKIKIRYYFMKMKTTIEFVLNEIKPKKNPEKKEDVVYYINLKNFNTEIIENISSGYFNTPETYKILCVDENNNPIYNYSSKELIKFTQNYAIKNEYNTSIIYDIIYAKKHNDKIFT